MKHTNNVIPFPRIHKKFREGPPSWLFTPTLGGPRFGLRFVARR